MIEQFSHISLTSQNDDSDNYVMKFQNLDEYETNIMVTVDYSHSVSLDKVQSVYKYKGYDFEVFEFQSQKSQTKVIQVCYHGYEHYPSLKVEIRTTFNNPKLLKEMLLDGIDMIFDSFELNK